MIGTSRVSIAALLALYSCDGRPGPQRIPPREDTSSTLDPTDGSCLPAAETTWYADEDGDGYGDPASERMDCSGRVGEIAVAGDCDDAEPRAYEGAVDATCDGIDNDCDGDEPQCIRQLADAGAFLEGWNDVRYLGRNVAFIGDINGDGNDDLGVAGTGDALNTTAVYLLSGASVPGATGTIDPLVLATYTDTTSPEGAGSVILPADDVDGDGLNDAWIGSPFHVAYGGSTGSIDMATADIMINVGVFDPVGSAASADANGDGFGDLLFTDSRLDTHLFLGPFHPGIYAAEDAALHLWHGLLQQRGTADIADFDGDGASEVLLGTDCEDDFGDGVFGDSVGLYAGGMNGSATGSFALPDGRAVFDFWIDCATEYQWAMGAQGAGDFNGDGYLDLTTADANHGYVLLGPLSGELDPVADAVFTWRNSSPDFVVGVPDKVGDLDGDGADEVAILAKGHALDSDPDLEVEVHVIRGLRSGLVGPTDSDAVWVGSASDSWTAAILRGGGDVDADGLPDAAVSIIESNAYVHPGHVYWMRGATLLGDL